MKLKQPYTIILIILIFITIINLLNQNTNHDDYEKACPTSLRHFRVRKY